MNLPELRDLYDYNRWAHEKTLDAASLISSDKYSRASSGPSLRAVLQNILAEEVAWLSRWAGHSLAEGPDYSECADTAALMVRWKSFWNRQRRFIESINQDELSRAIGIRLPNGIETEQSLGETMVHVVNQATSLRGEAALLIRQLGGAPPAADYFTYCLERGPDGADETIAP
jgi:uncharacterized damage-inducible protein DinB